MANSYPAKIGTKLGDCAGPNYRPDGRVHPGHLTGLQKPTWRPIPRARNCEYRVPVCKTLNPAQPANAAPVRSGFAICPSTCEIRPHKSERRAFSSSRRHIAISRTAASRGATRDSSSSPARAAWSFPTTMPTSCIGHSATSLRIRRSGFCSWPSTARPIASGSMGVRALVATPKAWGAIVVPRR